MEKTSYVIERRAFLCTDGRPEIIGRIVFMDVNANLGSIRDFSNNRGTRLPIYLSKFNNNGILTSPYDKYMYDMGSDEHIFITYSGTRYVFKELSQ